MSKKKDTLKRIENLFPDEDVDLNSLPSAEAAETRLEIQNEHTPHLGWDEYLDAIHHKENFGYEYKTEPTESVDTLHFSFTDISQTSKPGRLTTPLKAGTEQVGALLLDKPGHEWTSEEAELVGNIAQRIVQHIENLRLLEQAEHYRAESEEAVRRLTREGWQSYLETPLLTTKGYVYDSQQVKPLDPDQNLDARITTESTDTITHSIKIRDENIGQLAVTGIGDENTLTADILEAVANRLSIHIENLRLYEETERSRQQLDRRAAELETVARVSTAAATILSPQELMQTVVDLTKSSFNLYHAQIFLMSESDATLTLRAGSGQTGFKMVSEGLKIRTGESNSIVARAVASKMGIIVNDLHSEASHVDYPDLPSALCELAVPLIVGDQLKGVFDVLSEEKNHFTADDLQTYNTLGSQVAVALRNAELYAEQIATVARLRELDHLKSSFLANMSHELRTPFNSILGFTQVIMEGLDGPLTENMETDLALIEKNGRHLLNLISDVLDMAKIEAGRLSMNPEAVNLRDLLVDVFESSQGLIRNKNLLLFIENEAQANMVLLIDRIRMRQVLLNLVGNAIKFTEAGRIAIQVERSTRKVYIRIKDTGIGIPPDKLESIFQAFSQVDSSTTRKVGGTGLGLPISRRLVELHGGKLWAESKGIPGLGTTLVMELPLATPL